MPPDELLTIVLPVRDRTAFTRRWLAYHDAIGFPFRVLVADGGSTDEIADLVGGAKRFPRLAVEYRRYPYDATYSHFYAKLEDAVAHVETPLAAMVDNDDFYLVDGLRESVDFLTANPSYATCGGQCVNFWLSPDGREGGEDLVYSRRVDWKASSDAAVRSDETARQRVRNQSLAPAFPIYYHVHRSAQLREGLRLVRENDPKDVFMLELTLDYLTAISGKSMQLGTIFMARQQNAPGSSGCAHQAKNGDWFDRMLVPTWSGDFGAFLDVTAAALAREDAISFDEARRWLKRCYRITMASAIIGNLIDTEEVTTGSVLAVLATRRLVALPRASILRRIAKRIYRSVRWISPHSAYGTELRTRPVANAARDFQAIGDFLARGPAGDAAPALLMAPPAAPAIER